MPAFFMNAEMNTKEENVFNFIEDKLAFGVAEWEYYLTNIGTYIVVGSPLYSGIKEWANEWGIFDYCDNKYNNYDECPPEAKALLEKSYNQETAEYLRNNNLSQDELKMLRLLHMQYNAIKNYSKGIDIDNAKKTIASTYLATRKNCLEYLVSLKKISGPKKDNPGKYYWTAMLDRQGTQLCAVLTGIDPFVNNEIYSNSPIIMEDTNPDRSSLLSRMHNQFLQYQGLINEITKEQKEILRTNLDEIYYNSNASVNSRILNMGIIATDFFKDRDIALKYISNNYKINTREIDIKNEQHSMGK